MVRIMRDSTNPSDIPLKGTDIACGYLNGSYAWSAADFERFRKAGIGVAGIDVNGTNINADILDVEPGDASVQTAVNSIRRRKTQLPHAFPGIIYCDRSTLTPLFNAMNQAGFHIMHDFMLFIATLDGTERVPDMTGVVAVQYLGEPQSGGHYDTSKVYNDNWLKQDTPPPPAKISGKVTWGNPLQTRNVVSDDGGKTWK